MSLSLQPLDVPTAILQRRSIKTFKPDPIPAELLRQLVELTVAAPSSFNLQDWRIILIQDEAQKAALAEACWNQQQVVQAPVSFVFAANGKDGLQDLTAIMESARATGAWNDKTIAYFTQAIPQFTEGLGDKQREYAIKDAMIASAHLVLAAESLGLSTCYMNGWVEDKVKAVIGAADDPDLAIAVVVPVGYAAEPRPNPGRLPLGERVFQERLGVPYEG